MYGVESADTSLAMARPMKKGIRASFRRRSRKPRNTTLASGGLTEEDESVPSLDYQTAEVRKYHIHDDYRVMVS